jgi:hypothetical protein
MTLLMEMTLLTQLTEMTLLTELLTEMTLLMGCRLAAIGSRKLAALAAVKMFLYHCDVSSCVIFCPALAALKMSLLHHAFGGRP